MKWDCGGLKPGICDLATLNHFLILIGNANMTNRLSSGTHTSVAPQGTLLGVAIKVRRGVAHPRLLVSISPPSIPNPHRRTIAQPNSLPSLPASFHPTIITPTQQTSEQQEGQTHQDDNQHSTHSTAKHLHSTSVLSDKIL